MNKFTKKVGNFFRGRGFSSLSLTAIVIAVVVVFNVLAYTATSVFSLYIHMTEEDDLSLSGNTDALFKGAIDDGKKAEITFCLTEDVMKDHPTGSFVYKTAKYFEERYDGFIKINYVNFLTHRDQDGNVYDLSKYKKDMKGNDQQLLGNSVIFTCGNNYRVLTDTYTTAGFADFYTLDSKGTASAYNGEEVMASMLAWVLSDKHEVAYLTQNHGETADVAFSNLLSCAGYYVDVINLRLNEVPDDCGLLIISNPVTDFEKGAEGSSVRAEIERLNTYLEKGGNLYVALDPYSRQLPVLESFLTEHGITVSGTQTEKGYYRDIIKESGDAITVDGLTFVATYAEGNNLSQTIIGDVKRYGDGRVLMRDVARLTLSGDAKPLLVSSSSSVCVAGGKVVSKGGNYVTSAYSETKNEDGSYSHIFVVPSIFLTGSDALTATNYSNKDFLFSTLNHLFDSVSSPYGCKAVIYDTGYLENLTMGSAKLYTVLIMLIPTVIAIVGVVTLIRRKNR